MAGTRFPVNIAPTEPWHLWGNSVQMQVEFQPPTADKASTQVCAMRYKRPESWRFWFGARLLGGTLNTAAVDTVILVHFDLILGVGRSAFQTRTAAWGSNTGFARFLFTVAPGTAPSPLHPKWTTQVTTPDLDDVNHVYQQIDVIPAQDIAVEATMQVATATPGDEVVVEATAFFAPNVHVRPDWYADENQFLGSETKGT